MGAVYAILQLLGGRGIRTGKTNVKQSTSTAFQLKNNFNNDLTTLTTTLTTTTNSTPTLTETQTLPQEVTTSSGLHNRQASIIALNECILL